MASTIVDLCDEIAAAINGHSWTYDFRACRTYRPSNRKEELGPGAVEVFPGTQKRQRITRGKWHTTDMGAVVGIQIPLSAGNKDADADAAMSFADAVAEFLETYAFTKGFLKTIEEEPTFHPQRMDQDGVFTRALVLTFGGRATHDN